MNGSKEQIQLAESLKITLIANINMIITCVKFPPTPTYVRGANGAGEEKETHDEEKEADNETAFANFRKAIACAESIEDASWFIDRSDAIISRLPFDLIKELIAMYDEAHSGDADDAKDETKA